MKTNAINKVFLCFAIFAQIFTSEQKILYVPKELILKFALKDDRTAKNLTLLNTDSCTSVSNVLFDKKWNHENQLYYRNGKTEDKKSFKLYLDAKKIQKLILNSEKSPYVIESNLIKNLSKRNKELLLRTLFCTGISETILFKMQKNETTIFNDLNCSISFSKTDECKTSYGSIIKEIPIISIGKNNKTYKILLYKDQFKPHNFYCINYHDGKRELLSQIEVKKIFIKRILPNDMKNLKAILNNDFAFILGLLAYKDFIIDLSDTSLDLNSQGDVIKKITCHNVLAAYEDTFNTWDIIRESSVILNQNKKSLCSQLISFYSFCYDNDLITMFEQKINIFPLIFLQLRELKDIFKHDIAQIKHNNNNISSSILFKIADLFNNKEEIEDTKGQQDLFSTIEKALSNKNWTEKQLKKFTKTIALPELHNDFWQKYVEYLQNKALEEALEDFDLD